MHDHDHHSLKNHSPPHTRKNAHDQEFRLYVIFFALSLFAGIVEIVVKYLISNSVSLFGDGTHGINDGLSYLLLALVLVFSGYCPKWELTFTKIGVWLSFLLLFFGDYLVFSEAIERYFVPEEIHGWWTLSTVAFSFGLNLFVVWMIGKTKKEERNIRHDSVFFHALSDLWVSVGVILSAFIISVTGWYAADWIMAFVIAFYLLFLLCVLAIRIVRGNWKIGHDHSHGEDGEEHEHHHHHDTEEN